MNKVILSLIILSATLSFGVQAQTQKTEKRKLFLGYYLSNEKESKKFSISAEAATGSLFDTELKDKWHIRQNATSGYYNGVHSNHSNTTNNMIISHVGVKPEWLLAGDKICVGTGIRFTRINSSCLSDTKDDNAFFYLLYNQATNATEYARVKEIEQRTDYLGMPLEISYIPLKFELVSFYLKAGAQMAFKVKSYTNIQFTNSSMNSYEQSILEKVGTDINSTFASCYSSMGVKIGKTDRIKFNFEIVLPSKILTSNNSALFNSSSILGSGVMVSLHVPVK